MEGKETLVVSKTSGIGENQINVSANVQVKNKKVKLKNKKKKNQSMKLQLKKQENLNSNENIQSIKPIKLMDSHKVGEKEVEGGQSNKEGEENIDEGNQKTKKPVKRNNRDFSFHSEKMELTPLLHQETMGRTSHRDDRTLYVRFPPSFALRDKSYVEAMVPSAIDIRFPRLSPGSYAKFCYIEFETEEETTRMKDSLADIKINDEAFYADFVGKKSKAYNEKETRTVDPLRLYVGGLPKGIQASDIRAVFPTATRILYKKPSHKVSSSHAYLIYETHEEALSVFKASKGQKIHGKEVIVMFATYKNNSTNKSEEQSGPPAAKKQKTEDVRTSAGLNDGGGTEMEEESGIQKENKGKVK